MNIVRLKKQRVFLMENDVVRSSELTLEEKGMICLIECLSQIISDVDLQSICLSANIDEDEAINILNKLKEKHEILSLYEWSGKKHGGEK